MNIENNSKTIFDTLISGTIFDYVYEYFLPDSLQRYCISYNDISFIFKITQNDSQNTTNTLVFFTEDPNDYPDYINFELFTLNNNLNNYGYASILNLEKYSTDSALFFASDIDFGFYFDEQDSFILASPDDYILANNDEFGTKNWSYRKNTLFSKAEISADYFSNIFIIDDITSLEDCCNLLTKVANIKSDEYYFLKNEEVIGVIAVDIDETEKSASLFLRYVFELLLLKPNSKTCKPY